VKKKVSEIFSRPYGQDGVCCEPSSEEIERAVRESDLEKRGFQEHLDELKAEWGKIPTLERYDHIRKYHARRTAFFVVMGWNDRPFKLKKDGRELSDGKHRLRAAIHLGIDEVEVEVEGEEPE
jgi:hypothetical protein